MLTTVTATAASCIVVAEDTLLYISCPSAIYTAIFQFHRMTQIKFCYFEDFILLVAILIIIIINSGHKLQPDPNTQSFYW